MTFFTYFFAVAVGGKTFVQARNINRKTESLVRIGHYV